MHVLLFVIAKYTDWQRDSSVSEQAFSNNWIWWGVDIWGAVHINSESCNTLNVFDCIQDNYWWFFWIICQIHCCWVSDSLDKLVFHWCVVLLPTHFWFGFCELASECLGFFLARIINVQSDGKYLTVLDIFFLSGNWTNIYEMKKTFSFRFVTCMNADFIDCCLSSFFTACLSKLKRLRKIMNVFIYMFGITETKKLSDCRITAGSPL